MKKKWILLVLVVALIVSMLAACDDDKNEDGTYEPQDTVQWMVTSSPGGGSDIFTRKIQEIIQNDKMIEANIVVTNKTDGSGEVGRNEVAHKTSKADEQLLTFNSGDLMPMIDNTENRAEDFTILAIMAVDKQLIYKTPDSRFTDFQSVLDALNAGEEVVIAGSKGDDIATYNALINELGISKDSLKYITNDSTSDAITSVLGGHVDLLLSKPAASSEYVQAGELEAILALSDERYGGNLSEAPLLSEVDEKYKNVQVPVWRGVAAPKSMSEEASKFWSDILKQVSETEAWKTEYLDINMLLPNYMNHTEATEYVSQFQKDYIASHE